MDSFEDTLHALLSKYTTLKDELNECKTRLSVLQTMNTRLLSENEFLKKQNESFLAMIPSSTPSNTANRTDDCASPRPRVHTVYSPKPMPRTLKRLREKPTRRGDTTTLSEEELSLLIKENIDSGNFQNALFHISKLLSFCSDAKALNVLRQKAAVYGRIKRFKDGVAVLEEILRKEPKDWQSYALLGNIHRDQHKHFNALTAYKMALKYYLEVGSDANKIETLRAKIDEVSKCLSEVEPEKHESKCSSWTLKRCQEFLGKHNFPFTNNDSREFLAAMCADLVQNGKFDDAFLTCGVCNVAMKQQGEWLYCPGEYAPDQRRVVPCAKAYKVRVGDIPRVPIQDLE